MALPMASVSVVANAQKSVIYGHYWLTRTFGLPLSNEATLVGLSHVFRVRIFGRAALEVRRLFNMVDNFHVYLWGAELSTVRASALSQRQWVASQALRQFGGSIHVATFGSELNHFWPRVCCCRPSAGPRLVSALTCYLTSMF